MKTEREIFEGIYRWNYPSAELNWCNVTKSYTDPTEMRCWTMFQASTQRQGYKLVPVEATKEMLRELSSNDMNGRMIHKAMIGAAP